ncbi:alpha/beta hydrolase family protein [Parendozoicomonas haliclonae]|uniref:Prolyl tripeptidyl peptidase n=1 Tax=Parendozoicomonas haliclonae TaxID=1960125 RepID=A0A1X7AIQ5_9GAMM|nr:S9 family peptidase [Parendozoicomonas haliclonae]SMA44162.1 Prolyl tripeptidyl peptidase precursor [Parendozoicomonas haliclonae]
MGHLNKLLSLSAGVLLANSAMAVSVEDFAKHSEFYNVKISPDGKHLAVLMNDEGLPKLAFLRTEDKKPVFILKATKKSIPTSYDWISNERVLFSVGRDIGALEMPVGTGELYGINFDGSKSRIIAGSRSKSGIALTGYSYSLVDRLKDDDRHVLAFKKRWERDGSALPEIVKLNVFSGKEKRIKRAPMATGGFLLDNEGVPRFYGGLTDDYKTKLYYRKDDKSDWELFAEDTTGKFEPVAFSDDGKSVYILKGEENTTRGVYEYNIASGESELLYRSDIADPTDVLSSGDSGTYGVRMDEDYPTYVFLNNEKVVAKVHKALAGSFNGDKVTITSSTEDGKQVVAYVSGDRNPGEYYLIDTAKMSAQHLLSSRPWLKSSELALSEPFRLKSPDGMTINGYLTLPNGKSENLPLVVMPHGGPHARDYWGYNRDAQMLASKGYAVVQVNFRGSTGYGKSFEEAGWTNWGTSIQDDITLAANYAIQTGVADKDRVCIYGASFGGYSALQSAIREPGLYKCAIGYVGVYDLPMLYNEGDIKENKWGGAYLDTTLGNDESRQISQSPARHVDKLKAPVLIVHGKDDERAHIEHAYALRDALDKKGHPYEWLVKDKEAHGFYKEENIVEFYNTMLTFLDKHIGS